MTKHLHSCRDCFSTFWCRGESCASRWMGTCDECSGRPGEPAEERVAIGGDDRSRGTGCYWRVSAPGAE